MKNLNEYINEDKSANNIEINVGDLVEFDSAGLTIFGMIDQITDTDYIIKPFGCRAANKTKEDLKQEYKVKIKSAKRIWHLNVDDKFRDNVYKYFNKK